MVRDSDSFTLINTAGTEQITRLFGSLLDNPYEQVAQEPPVWDSPYSTGQTITGIVYNAATNRLYLNLILSGFQATTILSNINGVPAVDNTFLLSNSYNESFIGSYLNNLVRQDLSGSYWEIDVVSGMESSLGAILPSGTVVNNTNPLVSKTISNNLYMVNYNPITGDRITSVIGSGNVYTDVLPNTGYGSVTKDGVGNIYLHDEKAVYRLNYLYSGSGVVIKEGRKAFSQYAQLPALVTAITFYADSVAQLNYPVRYGSEGINREEEITLLPSTGFSAHSAIPISRMELSRQNKIVLDGFHYLDVEMAPNAQITINFEYQRIDYGLQGFQYYR